MGTLDASNEHHIATNHVLHHIPCTHSPSLTSNSLPASINKHLPTPQIPPPRPHILVRNPPMEARCTRCNPPKLCKYKHHRTRHGSARYSGCQGTIVTTPVTKQTNTTNTTTSKSHSAPPNPKGITATSDAPLDGHTLPPIYYQALANSTTASATVGSPPSSVKGMFPLIVLPSPPMLLMVLSH